MALAASSALFVSAGAAEFPLESASSRSRFLMGTVCEIVVDGDPSSTDAAFAEIERVEELISTWREGSELSQLNRSRDAVVSRELFTLLSESMRRAAATGGAFNPLVGPLVELWDTRGQGSIPAPSAVAKVMPLVELAGPRLDAASRRITLPQGVAFEEGGYGKGYALDRAAAALSSAGERAFLIDFGGQLMLRSQTPVEVAIANPERREEPAVLLTLSSGSLSTSSGSEKTFVVDGERFSHILDPRDGRALPPRGSVSVVSPSAFEADVLSTALYVMGPRDGLAWANAHGVAAIFIVPSGAGWMFLLSDESITSGLSARAARPGFIKKGDFQ